jgi:YaaC-like Protein
MAAIPLRIDGRQLKPHKCIVQPLLGTRTVLTNSPWGFVSLWLKRERKEEALFFWNQARDFHLASTGIALESAPLLHYYTFMNATKALLVAKAVAFEPNHGVRAHNIRHKGERISLSNEGVRILNRGVLPALSGYLGETEPQLVHTLQELLFNCIRLSNAPCCAASFGVELE